MFDVRQSDVFRRWLAALDDQRAVERIAMRIVRLRAGLFGDLKSLGHGVSEPRIDHGPGYRLYHVRRGRALIVLLCGGDKGCRSATSGAP